MPAEALKKLHTTMLDTREGYKVAEQETKEPGLQRLLSADIGSSDHLRREPCEF